MIYQGSKEFFSLGYLREEEIDYSTSFSFFLRVLLYNLCFFAIDVSMTGSPLFSRYWAN